MFVQVNLRSTNNARESMPLTQNKIVPYLLSRKFMTRESVVAGDVVVYDTSRRNSNFKVISEQGPCYLLKQGASSDAIATVEYEASVYRFLLSTPGSNELVHYLPHFYGYDLEERILILELLRDAQNMREYHVRLGRFPAFLARRMGHALGTLHRSTYVEREKLDDIHEFPGQPPWVLSIHRPNLGILRKISSANIQLIRIVQQFTEFPALLDELRHAWKTETLIHSDIKWDNWIVFRQPSMQHKVELKLVDWESACVGDPCWDVGSVFNDYLSFWLFSIPITVDTPPERFIELARFPLEKMQPAIRSFWQSYVQRMELNTPTSHEWLMRAVRYGAARLIQTAFEQMQMSMSLTGNIVCLLQLSLNIMHQTHEAIIYLLGIPL